MKVGTCKLSRCYLNNSVLPTVQYSKVIQAYGVKVITSVLLQNAMNRVTVTVLLRDPRDVLNVPKVIPRVKMKVVKVGKSGYTVKKAGVL